MPENEDEKTTATYALNRDLKSVGDDPDDHFGSSTGEMGLNDSAHDSSKDEDGKCMKKKVTLRSIAESISASQNGPLLKDKLKSANWGIYYKAREAYNLERLDAQNMKNLLSSLKEDGELFDKFIANYILNLKRIIFQTYRELFTKHIENYLSNLWRIIYQTYRELFIKLIENCISNLW